MKKLETHFEVVIALKRLNDEHITDEQIAENVKKIIQTKTIFSQIEIREVAE